MNHGSAANDPSLSDPDPRFLDSEPGSPHPDDGLPAREAMTSADIDREVEVAMASMSRADLAELRGEAGADGDVSPGTELTGTVVGVSNDDVFLQFGVKTQGVVPRSQFGKKEAIENGRRVDVVVERFDERAGLLVLSRKGAIQRATWTNLSIGMLVEGRATGVIKGGLEIDLKGIRAFMPASQCDIHPMKDISVLLSQVLRGEVIEIDRRNKNVILSRRKIIERERIDARDKLLAELEPGQTRKGVVGNLMEFGAFVDLGGVDGLIHIRDLSWGTVEKVSDVLSSGQEVEVLVLKVDREKHRISLGLKQALPDPWNGVEGKYPLGTNVKARIMRMADFGAFAELEPGVEALIPISEMGWSRVRKSTDAVNVGDVVEGVITRVEEKGRRIAISMKQAAADPWAGVLESYTPQSTVKGKITRIAGFGAFVELAPGVEGMIHISEMADRRVKSCEEIVQPEQEVEARVLGVDKENRRISLSLKAAYVAPQETPQSHDARADHKAKSRKKPLRGGLSSHFDW